MRFCFIAIECSGKVTAFCFDLQELIQETRANKFTNCCPTLASNENKIRTVEPQNVIQEQKG